MRIIYFGMKNILLKEIESIDQQIDVKRLFVDSSALGSIDTHIDQINVGGISHVQLRASRQSIGGVFSEVHTPNN